MATEKWPTKRLSVASVHLDARNPRLGREYLARAPREIIQYLFDHDKALDVAQSIAARGYFPNEPLLAVKENGRYVVVEGNRRLAALKALKEPGLLSPKFERQISRLAKQISDPRDMMSVPVTLAPSRRATDQQIAGRHIGMPVLAWEAENRASFILDKLEEGYDNDQLRDRLGFTLADIQKARQTRAIADMARSIDLPDEIKARLENPRAKIFTTVGRVFDSSVGREYLKVKIDPEHGLRGHTTKKEFLKGFTKLVHDVALGEQSSRTLNKSEDINKYFKSWSANERPIKKRGSFVPADIITGKSVSSSPEEAKAKKPLPRKINLTVLPKSLKVRFGNERLSDIRNELVRLKREDYPNAGAVLLRVFLELSALHYLERSGELPKVIKRLGDKGQLRYGTPAMKQLVPTVIGLAKKNLSKSDAIRVEKAIKYDAAAPFTLSDLHAFVHQDNDMPSARDILQFWLRTESLFRLMLEQDLSDETQ